MESGAVSIAKFVIQAFSHAKANHPSIANQWLNLSVRWGSRLNNSTMMVRIQQHGDLDILVRALEDELSPTATSAQPDGIFAGHYAMMLSELWIESIYETVRALNERLLIEGGEEWKQIYRDLTLVRIPLAKHEISGDRKLKEPLKMFRFPADEYVGDGYTYDPKDPLRAHIPPRARSHRGSLMWQVIDLRNNGGRWLERQSISDRILAFVTEPQPPQPMPDTEQQDEA